MTLFGPARNSTRSSRRAFLQAAPRGVESLENRQLLSSGAVTHRHVLAPHTHSHAVVESRTKNAPAPTVTYYDAANTTDAQQFPISGWQGIRNADTPGQYLITGTSNATGILYVGSISGQGTSYAVNDPLASSTSVYGPNNLGGGQFQLVGSYRTTSSSIVYGF
jgi:hypothetical protein